MQGEEVILWCRFLLCALESLFISFGWIVIYYYQQKKANVTERHGG